MIPKRVRIECVAVRTVHGHLVANLNERRGVLIRFADQRVRQNVRASVLSIGWISREYRSIRRQQRLRQDASDVCPRLGAGPSSGIEQVIRRQTDFRQLTGGPVARPMQQTAGESRSMP